MSRTAVGTVLSLVTDVQANLGQEMEDFSRQLTTLQTQVKTMYPELNTWKRQLQEAVQKHIANEVGERVEQTLKQTPPRVFPVLDPDVQTMVKESSEALQKARELDSRTSQTNQHIQDQLGRFLNFAERDRAERAKEMGQTQELMHLLSDLEHQVRQMSLERPRDQPSQGSGYTPLYPRHPDRVRKCQYSIPMHQKYLQV